jgi:hypothetical protein
MEDRIHDAFEGLEQDEEDGMRLEKAVPSEAFLSSGDPGLNCEDLIDTASVSHLSDTAPAVHYDDDHDHHHVNPSAMTTPTATSSVREVLFDIEVPPGPLGILLDKRISSIGVIERFVPLPSGTKGLLELHPAICAGCALVKLNGQPVEHIQSLDEIGSLLARTAPFPRVLTFKKYILSGRVMHPQYPTTMPYDVRACTPVLPSINDNHNDLHDMGRPTIYHHEQRLSHEMQGLNVHSDEQKEKRDENNGDGDGDEDSDGVSDDDDDDDDDVLVNTHASDVSFAFLQSCSTPDEAATPALSSQSAFGFLQQRQQEPSRPRQVDMEIDDHDAGSNVSILQSDPSNALTSSVRIKSAYVPSASASSSVSSRSDDREQRSAFSFLSS